MGRQAYLTKIAFGRSAFEPTPSATQTAEYVQLESSQSELPRAYQEATPNGYIQLFDERGNPINPRSHDYGKKLRDAQNDVLASVGVVERRRSPSEGLPGSYENRLELLEAEDTAGNVVALASTLAENLCTWWIGTTRERILTFRHPDHYPFAQIVTSEQGLSGSALVYAGFAPRLLSTLSIQAVVYGAFVWRPIDRLLYATQASSRTRSFFRRSKGTLKSLLRLTLEVLFYPFSYHASLQRLGLIPARPLLPPWKSFIPFSKSSPLLPFSLHYDASASILDCIKATLTSPVILVCAEYAFERWIYGAIYEAVESSIIRPDNTEMQSRDAGDRDRATAIFGLRRQSPPLVRDMINKLLNLLSWGHPLPPTKTETSQPNEPAHSLDCTDGLTLDIDGIQVTNLTPLELPAARTQGQTVAEPSNSNTIEAPIDTTVDNVRPTTPLTPTASMPEQEDNDPRIRITSREGIVEMEVRLPPRVLSSHTEVVDAVAPSQNRRTTASRNNALSSPSGSRHRITQLSSEPAQMIGAIIKGQLVGLAILPIKLVALRLVAAHYFASQRDYKGPSRIIRPLPSLSDLTWRSVGIHISRVALCSTLEFTIDLGLWGLQYLAITRMGQTIFGWNTL